ncbi:MAG: D-2-hydroxyacid dehydrogenase [Lachnospiraceae bacterium]|nr:D-2-hydroxyacid dehydrogenase [Lachnospiraceae bacterium]
MKKILVSLGINEGHKALLEKIAAGRAEFTYRKISETTPEDVLQADGIIGKVNPAWVSQAKQLQWLQLNSAGMDAFLKPGILPENCILHSAVGAYGLTVSEHMLALTFALVRNLPQYARNQAESNWKDEGPVISVCNSTVLVLGLGDIGGSYARKLKALGAYVIGVRQSDKPKPEYLDEQYTIDKLDEVIGRADIIASVLPSAPGLQKLFNEERFGKVKKGVYLLNCGRGDLIDQEALKKALDDGIVKAAALDVTSPEPLPADDSLWNYRNVMITPHVAGGFHLQQTVDRIVELAAEHMDAWLSKAE